MRDILVSDWTLAAFKRRADERRKSEAATPPRIAAEEAKPRVQGIVVSDWTLGTLKPRDDERRKLEAATPEILVSEWANAARKHREEEQGKIETAMTTRAAAEEPKPCTQENLFSDSTFAAFKQLEDGWCEQEEVKATPVRAEEVGQSIKPLLVSDAVPVASERRDTEPRKTEVAATVLVELARLVDTNADSRKKPIQLETQPISAMFTDALTSTEQQPVRIEEPAVRRDFGAIDVEDLSARGNDAAPLSDGPVLAVALDVTPAVGLEPRDRRHQSGVTVLRQFGAAHKESRSHRGVYSVAAVIVLGLGVLAAVVALRSGGLAPAEITDAKVQRAAPRSDPEAMGGEQASQQSTSISEIAPQSPPAGSVNNGGQPAAVSPAQQRAAPVGAQEVAGGSRTEPAVNGAPAALTQPTGEEQGAASPPAEEVKIWTVTISPDGSVVRKGELVPAPTPPPPRLPATAPTSSPESTGQAATSPTSAAPDNSHDPGRIGHAAGKPKGKAGADAAKVRAVRPAAAHSEATARSETASQSSSATGGSFGFMRRAADSITNAIKELGGAAGSRP
jgi:hypothetical protein